MKRVKSSERGRNSKVLKEIWETLGSHTSPVSETAICASRQPLHTLIGSEVTGSRQSRPRHRAYLHFGVEYCYSSASDTNVTR